jgi:hypothetical protein
MEPERDFFEELGDKRTSIFTRIKWKLEAIQDIPRNIREGVSKIIYWLPIIWKDRDWDSYYTLKVLSHKLKAQAAYISKNDRHTRAQHDARNIRICVNLIEKVQEDTYAAEYLDYTVTKNWFEPCEDQENYSTWESKEVSETYDDYFNKYPLIYKRVLNGEGRFKSRREKEDRQAIAMSISHINQTRAHDLLFKILKNESLSWWD